MELWPSIILGLVGTGITIYYAWHSKKMAHDQMMKELFTEFNKRYDALNEHLEEIKINCKTIDDLKDNIILKNKLTDFFNLCAEEYFWHKKKRIDNEVWHAWESGMNDWYNQVKVIQLFWDEEFEKSKGISYYIKSKNEFFKLRS